MKRFGILAAGALALTLCLGTLSPASAQGQGGGQGRRGGFGQGRGGFGFGGGMMNNDPTRSSSLMLLQRPDVRTELNISARQREQMEAEQQKAMEAMRNNRADFQALRDLPEEERRAKMQEMREQMQTRMQQFNKDMNEKVAGILTPAQAKRLGELDLQWRGPLSLGDEAVAKRIGMTPDQERQLGNIMSEYRTGQQEVMRAAFGDRGQRGQGGGQGGPPDPAEMRARMEKIRAETDRIRKASEEKVVAMLSAEQKQTWKGMIGKSFTFRNDQQQPNR